MLLTVAPDRSRRDEALVLARAGYLLNPQDAFTMRQYGLAMANAGDPVEGIRLLERSLRINPRDPMNFNTYVLLAFSQLINRDYRSGLEWALQARTAAPAFPMAHLHTAAHYVGLGEIDKARQALALARQLAPELVDNRTKRRSSKDRPDYLVRNDTFLRIAAGLEDPGAADALR